MARSNDVLLLCLNWSQTQEFGAMTGTAKALPLEYVYISSVLIGRGVAHEFVDLWVENKTIADVADKIRQTKIVVLDSAPSYLFWRDGIVNITLVRRCIEEVKAINPQAMTVLIGPHGSVVPSSLDGCGLDFLMRGEPDETFPSLAERILRGESVGNIKSEGVLRSVDGKFAGAVDSVEVSDLGRLPKLDYSHFNFANYSFPHPSGRVPATATTTAYEATRGCPYKCIFCFKVGFRDKFRRKPLERVDAELADLKSLGVSYIYLIDEISFLEPEWAAGLLQLLKKHGIFWGCQTRPALLTDAMVDRIIESETAGLIQIGLEHTDSEVLKAMRKADTDVEMLTRSVKRLTDAGVDIDLFVVSGLPGDSPEKLAKMAELFKRFPLDKVRPIIHSAMPFPGTRLWEIAKEKGYALEGWDDVNRFRGSLNPNFTGTQDVANESYRLAGLIAKARDGQAIANDRPRLRNYLRFMKHDLDSRFPRFMQTMTRRYQGLKSKA